MAKRSSRAKAKAPKAKKSTPKKPPAKTPGNATPVKELERLARLADDCKTASKKFSDKIGGEIKKAAKTKHLNAKAFRAVLAERRMGGDDPIKLRDYLAACEYYRDALGIDDLKAPDMMRAAKPKKTSERTSSGLKPLGAAADNVVSLAGAMKDAIDKDNSSQKKPEMEVA